MYGTFAKRWNRYFLDNGCAPEYGADVPLCLTAAEDGVTVALTTSGTPDPISIETSTDNRHWSTYTVGTDISLPKSGDRVFFRGQNNTFSKSGNYYIFASSGHIYASGNVNSLYDPTCQSVTIPDKAYFFAYLFYNCAGLLTPPLLPSTRMRNRCYANMFRGTAIKFTPELPATSSASYCYQNMFMSCPELVETRLLPFNSINAYNGIYYGMFNGCSNLSKVYVALNSWGSQSNATTNWLNGVAATGTFICPAALDTTTRSVSRVPEGWTVETY